MNEEVTLETITPETCFVPATHQGRGRRTPVAPEKTAMRYLHYGRITLAPDDEPVSFANDDQETGLICLKGRADVKAEGRSFHSNNMTPFTCRVTRSWKSLPLARKAATWLKSRRLFRSDTL